MYIRGRPGDGLGDETTTRSQAKCIRSLVFETPAIPNTTRHAFNFIVRGRTSINLSCPLSRLTPSSFLVAMAPQLSPFTRTSDVTIPRQSAPTMGPLHGGFEFLKGNFEGLKGYVVGRMTQSRRGKIYIDDEGWGLDAGSIEYGYRVPFGEIHIFLKIHLFSIACRSLGKSTKVHTLFSYMDPISDFMASSHFAESGLTIASS